MSQDDPRDSDNNNPGGVQHDQGEDYQQPITFSRVSQSGQVELRIDTYTLYLTPTTLYLTELDNVVP